MLMRCPGSIPTRKAASPHRAKCASAQPTHHPTGRKEHRDRGQTLRLKGITDVKTDEKIMEEMKQAISNYTGSVTRCPPGKARAPVEGAVLKKNASVEWLRQHRYIKPITDPDAMRRQVRIQRGQRSRIAERNAAIKKRLGER